MLRVWYSNISSLSLALWSRALLEMYCLSRLTSVGFITREQWKPCKQRACSVLLLCEQKRLQTGATQCVSVRFSSWGRPSALTGDDITWQVFIWLISRVLATTQAADTCFTSKALTHGRRAGQDRGSAVAGHAKFYHAALLWQNHVRRRWGRWGLTHHHTLTGAMLCFSASISL